MKVRIVIVAAVIFAGCCPPAVNMEENNEARELLNPGEALVQVNLTVAEGKRLIAEGIANDEMVKARLLSGMVIITRGTTNTYIAERLAGLTAPRGSFITGHIRPEGSQPVETGMTTEIILVDGVPTQMTYQEALQAMSPGDIVFKGGNLLNYSKGQAALLVGSADGGTVGRLRPFVGDGKGQLIVPIGLEKDCSWDLATLEATFGGESAREGVGLRLWTHQDARIYTEIEALHSLAGVKAFPIAAGGIMGREGGVTLVIAGSRQQIEKALEIIAELRGEGAFITTPMVDK